jgi:hypothetical protein
MQFHPWQRWVNRSDLEVEKTGGRGSDEHHLSC